MKDERFGGRLGGEDKDGTDPLKQAVTEAMAEEVLKEKKFLPIPNWSNLAGRDQARQEVGEMKRETLERLTSLGYGMVISLKNLLEGNLKINLAGVPAEAVFVHYVLQFKLMYEDWVRQVDALIPDTEEEENEEEKEN